MHSSFNLTKIFILGFILIIHLSCSSFNEKSKEFIKRKFIISLSLDSYEYYTNKDYLDHLIGLGEQFVFTSKELIVLLNKEHEDYLASLCLKIMKSNELIFSNKPNPKIYIFQNTTPFYFSLPQGKLFISLGLLQRYLRNEGDLLSILAYEMGKSYLNIYPKTILFPKGHMTLEQLLSITRVSLHDKILLNEWAFIILKRSGSDPYSYLTWLQQLNKNSIDFAAHLGDINIVMREENQFKNFIDSKDLNSKLTKINKNSSKEFYKFIYDLRKILL